MFSKQWFYSGVVVLGVIGGLGFRFLAPSDSPSPSGNLTDVAPYPADPSKVLVASERELYLRTTKQNWKRVFSLEGKSLAIQRLMTHPAQPEKIFILTKGGVLKGELKTGRFQWIFREKNQAGNRIHALELHPRDSRQIYLGTERGLFRSADGGQTWKGPGGWPETERIEFVGVFPSHPPLFLLAAGRELFFSKNGGVSFESGFSLPPLTREAEEEDPPPFSPRFTSFAFSFENPSQIWVGTLEGVFESRDAGVSWARLPEHGLEAEEIHDLVFCSRWGQLIAATSRGVFQFHTAERRWKKLPIGITKLPVSLALQSLPEKSEEILLVASGSEIFEWPLGSVENAAPLFLPSPERTALFQKWVRLEPPVREIQKRAVGYGGLGNGKIHRWQWGSRLRAFVPRLTFSKDFSIGNNIDIDRGSTNDPDRFIHGPEDTDRGWDLGLTWELGDLLYSTAQTSIDSRAKLLVELRESILGEVTRLYFERRRVQAELVFSGPEMTLEERMSLSLRLEELTAQIDALTDGFLSEQLEEIYRDHPELNRYE